MSLDKIEKDVGYIAEQLEWTRTQHYGLWDDKEGWWRSMTFEVFSTTSEAVARAQCQFANAWERNNRPGIKMDWHVKCFEEWADDQ